MRRGRFVSVPGSCKRCPLRNTTPVKARIEHLCHLYTELYTVHYRRDDATGDVVCEVTKRMSYETGDNL